MGVTIKDVAKKCGMSITTVSLVLNNKDSRISEKTKQIITEAAQELNYIPNRMAVGLVTKKTFTIGLIVPGWQDSYCTSLIQSAEAACRNAGFFLSLYQLPIQSAVLMKNYFHTIVQNVDGIIFDPSFYTVKYNNELLERLSNASIPVVSLGPIASQVLPNSIVIDRRQGAYLAAEHLLERGHERIGCVYPASEYNIYSSLSDGYQSAVEDYGKTFEQELIKAVDESPEALESALKALTAAGATAIIAYSAITAANICQLARRTGLRIPDQLSLVSLEDSAFLPCMDPPIAACSLHADRAARKAVNLIRKISLDRQEISSPEMIAPFFFERGSIQKNKRISVSC